MIVRDNQPTDGDEKEDWFVSKITIATMAMAELNDAISRRGVLPKGKKCEKQTQLQICVDNAMAICEGPIQNMQQLGGFPPSVTWKVLEAE